MAERQHPVPRKLWEHPNKESTDMWKFKLSLEKAVKQKFEVSLSRGNAFLGATWASGRGKLFGSLGSTA